MLFPLASLTARSHPEKIASKKIVKFQGQLHEFPADFTDEDIATALRSTMNPWASVGRVASITFGIPLAVLILGASLVPAFAGLASRGATPP
jgi:hypothetical protein